MVVFQFWMGVHPNGPARLLETSEDLSNRLKNHPNLLAAHEKGLYNSFISLEMFKIAFCSRFRNPSVPLQGAVRRKGAFFAKSSNQGTMQLFVGKVYLHSLSRQ